MATANPAQASLLPGARYGSVLLLLVAGQLACSDWQGGLASMTSIAVASAFTTAALGLCYRTLLAPEQRVWLLVALGITGWLLITLFTSLIPEASIALFWSWMNALMVALCVLCLSREGLAMHAVAALLAIPVLRALAVAWEGLIPGSVFPAFVPDANIAASTLLACSLITLAMLMPGARMSPGQQLVRATLAALLLLLCFNLLDLWLSARVTLVAGLFASTALLWHARPCLLRGLPLIMLLASCLLTSLLVAPELARTAATASLLTEAADEQFTFRLRALDSTWQWFLQHPLTGTGLGSFGYLFRMQPLADLNPAYAGNMAHNDWMQLLMETGLPLPLAMTLFACLCACAWLRCMARLAQGEEGQQQSLALGCLSGALVMLLQGLTNFPLYDPLTLASILGMGTAGLAGAGRRLNASGGIKPGGYISMISMGKLLTGISALSAAGLGWAWSWLLLQSFGMILLGASPPLPWMQRLRFDLDTQWRYAHQLRRVLPGWSGAWYIEAYAISDILRAGVRTGKPLPAALVMQARAAYEQAAQLNPYTTEHHLEHALMLIDTGVAGHGEADVLLAHAQYYDPVAATLWLHRIQLANSLGHRQSVRQLLMHWLPACEYGIVRAPGQVAKLLALLKTQPLPQSARIQAIRCSNALHTWQAKRSTAH